MTDKKTGILLSTSPNWCSEESWRLAESLVHDWRFNGPRDSSGINPRIVLEHNDHWNLVERIARLLEIKQVAMELIK